MTVVICNQVALTSETLRAVEDASTRIFRDAGVDISWIKGESNCTTPVPLPSTKVYFVVIAPIVPDGWTTGPDSMGLAPRNDLYRHAYVFYDRVQEFVIRMKLTRDIRINDSLVLGDVIVHEIGHLLLHGKGRSGKGIMNEQWNPQDLMRAVAGTLRFDPQDARLLKTELSR
jgi:hypothetical protein